MKPMAQVRHVLTKDLRQLWWPVCAYVALIGLAAAHSIAWPKMTNDVFGILMIFVVMSGMVVVAQFVQADSPRRTDALWASRPLAPWAVLIEKLIAAALIVLALAVLGQFIGLRTLDVPVAMMPGLLAESARQYALWLLIAIVLAALTEDLRGFVVALVALPIVLLIVAETFFSGFDTGPTKAWTPIALGAVAATGGVALLAFIYSTRSRRRSLWLAAFVISGCAFASILAPWRGKPAALEPPASLPKVGVSARLVDLDQISMRRDLSIVVDAAPPPGPVRMWLVAPVLFVRLRNGQQLSIPIAQSAFDLSSPPPLIGQGVTWIVPTNRTTLRQQYSIPLDDAQRGAVAGGIASAELVGDIWVTTPRVRGTFPLAVGARAAHGGTRIAVEHWSHSAGVVALQVRMASLSPDQLPPNVFMFNEALTRREFALLNDDHHEAIALTQRRSSGGGSPMVLPGTNVEDAQLALEVAQPNPGAPRPIVDDDWFRSARLVQIDWVPRGSYPFRTSVQLP